MSRLFGAYIIVDYSAAEGKKTGESSVWIGVMKRDVRFRLSYECFNPSTRLEAANLLKTLIADFQKRNERVYLGVDFALGGVRGTAQKLGPISETPQKSYWSFLAKNIVDKADNTNNRFAVAGKMNRLLTDQAYPYWGCPKNAAQKWLSTLKPLSFEEFPEYRLTEAITHKVKSGPKAKSQWQMYGAGVVGGQSMLGIVMLNEIIKSIGPKALVWPFDTGLGALTAESLNDCVLVCSEIYPSLYATQAHGDEVKDATQVRVTAETFAELDNQGSFANLFAAHKDLSENDIETVVTEEGWILGV